MSVVVKSERNPQCDETSHTGGFIVAFKKRITYFFLVSALPVNLKF